MRISFLGQPFEPFGWAADWLRERLNDARLDHLEIAAAWMKRSGLTRIRPEIESFRARGGLASVIVGIDEGGATKQGLALAYDMFDHAYVFHDRSSRTFHPKVYLVTGNAQAHLLIGSNNVTAGGLFNNYEASLSCELDLNIDEDRVLLQQVRSWFDTLYNDAVCKLLDANFFALLLEDPNYRIADEDRPIRSKPQEEDYDGVLIGDSERLFGTSSSEKKGMAPRLSENRQIYTPRTDSEESASPISQPEDDIPQGHEEPLIEEQFSSQVALRWFKRMSAADAQRPTNPNSNTTGNLKLARAGHDIDQKTFFRYEMFGSANWSTEQRSRGSFEEAIVPFEVIFAGVDLGQINLKIDHAEFRIANQGNVPTWLHWGALRERLQSSNYTQSWVIIERRLDGTYVLEITRNDPAFE
jgi:hypothetical protein